MATKFVVTGDQRDEVDARMCEIKRQLRLKGGSPLDPEQVAEALQRIVEGRFEIPTAAQSVPSESQPAIPTTYQVTVDYGQTLEQMIAAGRYDTRNYDITQDHFPLQGTGQVEVELHLVHLGRDASTVSVLAELERRNLRPATLSELLALGAKYPDLQKEFHIVALGSVWQNLLGDRGMAYLGCWYGRRRLILHWIDDDWYRHCRFLAVSK